MSRTVWKYPIPIEQEWVLELPEGARVLHVGMQGVDPPRPFVWFEVDPARGPSKRQFTIVGTGHDVPHGASHRGTFFTDARGTYVFHLYELVQ